MTSGSATASFARALGRAIRSRGACVLSVVLLAVHVSAAAGAALAGAPEAGRASEYQVKAAVLLNFAKFVEWPAAAFDSPSAPVVFGVMGQDPFGKVLPDVLRNNTVRGRPLAVRYVGTPDEAHGCHLLFIADSERSRMARTIAAVGPGILTVGETEQFAERGGIVELTLDAGRVRFTINQAAAERASLRFSSKLLSLARVIHPTAGGAR